MVVVDEALAPGLAANAAAVMAMTLGTKVPALVGDEFVDGGREVAVARPCIVLQDVENRPVSRIKSWHSRSSPWIVRSSA